MREEDEFSLWFIKIVCYVCGILGGDVYMRVRFIDLEFEESLAGRGSF